MTLSMLRPTVFFLASLLLLGCAPSELHQTDIGLVRVEVPAKPGLHASPTGECRIRLSVSELGGWIELQLNSGLNSSSDLIAQDVTGIGWLSGTSLVYSASPIYGSPGIFVLDCLSAKSKELVSPKNMTPAYPKGADYFELYEVIPEEGNVLFFYANDVDGFDFNGLRRPENLLSVRIHGE